MRYLVVGTFGISLGIAAHAATPAATALPIAQGIWIASTDKCGTAYSGMVYDGRRWGQVYYYGEGGSLGPVAEFETVVGSSAVKGGFTNMKLTNAGGAGYFHVKSLGGDRMILRTGAPGRNSIDVWDETLVRCNFTSLSPRMQAAVRKFAPTVAVGAPAVQTAQTPPAVATSPAAAWKVTPIKGGSLAIYGGKGLVRSLTVTCAPDGGGEIFIETNARARSSRMTVVFRSDDGGQPALALDYFAKQDIWAGKLSSVVAGSLMYGNAITVDMGALGKDRISLAGSGTAIRTAMNQCLFEPATATPALAPLGISPGYYAPEGELCGDANGLFYYDGRRYGMIYDSAAGGVGPIGRPRKVGKQWQLSDGSRVEPRGPGKISWSYEESAPYRLCPTASIPMGKRVR